MDAQRTDSSSCAVERDGLGSTPPKIRQQKLKNLLPQNFQRCSMIKSLPFDLGANFYQPVLPHRVILRKRMDDSGEILFSVLNTGLLMLSSDPKGRGKVKKHLTSIAMMSLPGKRRSDSSSSRNRRRFCGFYHRVPSNP